jgi:hypothetical protein
MTNKDTAHLIGALASNWQAEMRGYHTYQALSEQESDAQRRRTLRNLALAEKHHADLWATRLTVLGAAIPKYDGAWVGRSWRCGGWNWMRVATLLAMGNRFAS